MSPVIAVALTWDGARWPVSRLPSVARTFLRAGQSVTPLAAKMAILLTDKKVHEIRICWVPRLAGGKDVMAAPFPAPQGKRIKFRVTRTVRLGDSLGVVYRR